jgi:hypothetical protein
MKRTVEILVSPMGDISIDAIGFKGADCEKATAYLEEALGRVAAKTRKPEYRQSAAAKTQQRVGQ